jgi:beta-alanine--pyruvate transaminase
MSLKGLANVTDIRTLGLVAAIDLESIPGAPGKRAYEAMEKGFHDHGIMLRITGDTIALSPPLIIERDQISQMFEVVRGVLRNVA